MKVTYGQTANCVDRRYEQTRQIHWSEFEYQEADEQQDEYAAGHWLSYATHFRS